MFEGSRWNITVHRRQPDSRNPRTESQVQALAGHLDIRAVMRRLAQFCNQGASKRWATKNVSRRADGPRGDSALMPSDSQRVWR